MTGVSHDQPPLVTLSGVTKTFDTGVTALDGLNLAVRRGEFLTLLGASGCGKSTALRILAGLETPSSGTVRWSGAGKPRIGFVFQEPTLMPWASVAANVALPLSLRGLPVREIDDRVDEALMRVGLERFTNAMPRELSGGMKMRASIARALVDKPDVLLMDEPFAALDEITRFRLNDDLLAVWEALGQTVVFVTHSVFESVFLSQRIVVMARPGRLVDEIAITNVEPRDEGFRTSVAYAALCRRTSAGLNAAIGAGGAR
jgi:NitT/TauT family transport system ATP-binding protein